MAITQEHLKKVSWKLGWTLYIGSEHEQHQVGALMTQRPLHCGDFNLWGFTTFRGKVVKVYFMGAWRRVPHGERPDCDCNGGELLGVDWTDLFTDAVEKAIDALT
jgi:hypothetical protein